MGSVFNRITLVVTATANRETVYFAYVGVIYWQFYVDVQVADCFKSVAQYIRSSNRKVWLFVIFCYFVHCLKAEKLDRFFQQWFLFVIKKICTIITEVTDITLYNWGCMPQFQSFRITSSFLIQNGLYVHLLSLLSSLALTKDIKYDNVKGSILVKRTLLEKDYIYFLKIICTSFFKKHVENHRINE